jgi:hypothetical protein
MLVMDMRVMVSGVHASCTHCVRVDVDECAGVRVCAVEARCTNSVGAYTCDCPSGMAGDGHTQCTVDKGIHCTH